jgi:hypothetical protein
MSSEDGEFQSVSGFEERGIIERLYNLQFSPTQGAKNIIILKVTSKII